MDSTTYSEDTYPKAVVKDKMVIGVPYHILNKGGISKEAREVFDNSVDKLKKLGFEIREETSKGYYKYQNNGTIHYNKDYNRDFPEPRGKVLISVNTTCTTSDGVNIPYIGIKQDAGTRTVYDGLCPDKNFLIQLLNNIR